MRVIKVSLNKKEIDTVFWYGKDELEDIKKSLIDHDGYDSRIVVVEDNEEYIV